MPALPADVVLKTVSTAADLEMFSTGPISPAEAERRFSEGDTCHIALSATSGVAGQVWCTEKSRFIEWIGCDVKPPVGHVHVYNLWVGPRFRGLGVQWNLASLACSDIVGRGLHHMCAGFERQEYPALARKYAALGLGHIAPYKSVWALLIGGVAMITVRTSPPGCLQTPCYNAGRVFARHWERA